MGMNVLGLPVKRLPRFIPLTAILRIVGMHPLGGPLGTILAEFLLLRIPMLFRVVVSSMATIRGVTAKSNFLWNATPGDFITLVLRTILFTLILALALCAKAIYLCKEVDRLAVGFLTLSILLRISAWMYQ